MNGGKKGGSTSGGPGSASQSPAAAAAPPPSSASSSSSGGVPAAAAAASAATAGGACPAPVKGAPLPDHFQIVRLAPRPGDEAHEFLPKDGETTIAKTKSTAKKEPGFSVQAPPSDAKAPLTADAAKKAATAEFKSAFPHVPDKAGKAVSAAELRAAGFDVIHDPTSKLPGHATLIKKGGGNFTQADAATLAGIFK